MKLLPKLQLKTQETNFPERFLGIDLGGSSVKIALFGLSFDQVELLGLHREESGEDPKVALGKGMEALAKDFPDLPKSCVWGVSGPRVKAFSTAIKGADPKSLDEILEQVQKATFDQALREFRTLWGDQSLELINLETEVIEIERGRDLEILLFTSFAETRYLSGLQKLANDLKLSPWAFSFIPFNIVTSFREENLNALLLDVGRKKTEVTLVFGGQVMDSKAFLWEFPTPPLEDLGAPRGKSLVAPNSPEFLDVWVRAVKAAISDFPEVKIFPSKLYLYGGAAKLPGLLEGLQNYPWGEDLPLEQEPSFSFFAPSDFERLRVASLGELSSEDIGVFCLGSAGLRIREEKG